MTAMIFECVDAFSAAECDRVVALAAGLVPEAAGVLGAGGYAPAQRVRRATTTYLPQGSSTAWLYARLDAAFATAAATLGQRVAPIVEPPQLVCYRVGDHFNTWHSDAGTDLHANRCVSGSVELSDAADYDGGLPEIAPVRMSLPRTAPRGSATMFPSRVLHHVTPVPRGVRLALVAWAGV